MMRDALATELRVLSGLHAGACAEAQDGLLLGAGDDADVILTDLAADAGLARLHLLEGGRWLLWPAADTPDDAARAQAPHLGVARHWGGLALCVSAPHTDWPALPPESKSLAPALESAPAASPAVAAPPPVPAPVTSAAAKPAVQVQAAVAPLAQASVRRRWRAGVIAAAVLAGVALAALAWLASRRSSEVPGPAAALREPAADLTAQAQRQIPALQLVIARVDPALRLQLTPLRNGRVQVSGWADSLTQLDRLADALAAHQPPPWMRVAVVSELRGELRAMLGAGYPSLDFGAAGPTAVAVRGIVRDEAAKTQALAAVRAVLPPHLELADELRLAEQMAPDVQNALVAAGFEQARARWSGEEVVATVPIAPGSRARLENALVALTKQFAAVPLRIVPEAVAAAAPEPVTASAPYPIRAVVSGPSPYLILPDGSRVQPGGSHAGWRLQSIDADVLVFDAPRRRVVRR